MTKRITKKLIMDYILMIVGVFITAAAVSLFFEPANLVTGGFTGLGIIIQDVTSGVVSIPLWLSNAALNIPLFLVAIKVKGLRFVGKTLFAALLFSPALVVTAWIPLHSEDILLGAVFGGALSGLGLGLVFRAGATTGGTDLLAWIVHHYKRHFQISAILLAVDSAIITAGFLVFGAERSLYAVIAAYVSSKTVTAVLEGLSYARSAYIISDRAEEIGRRLMTELERGVTSLSGKGLYTDSEKNVILCVVSGKEMVRVKEIARNVDKDAFVIVSDVREVLGEGFQS